MSPFRINHGLFAKKPLESYYAHWRRVLVANPGIPLSTLRQRLRDSDSAGSYPDAVQSELNHQDPLPSTDLPGTYQRQCPECAKELYHSDLFSLPWLTACPIHHQPFTRHCPECGQLWPSVPQMSNRECSTCGRPSIRALGNAAHIRDLTSRYQPIAQLHELIKATVGHNVTLSECHLYRGGYITISNKHHIVDLSDPLFPSLQLAYATNISNGDLERLHVYHKSMKCRRARVKPLQSSEELDNTPHPRPDMEEHGSWFRWTREKSYQHFIVFREILDWIHSRSRVGHNPYITSYMYLTDEHLQHGPPPCICCMALSIWLAFLVTYPAIAFKSTRHLVVDEDWYPFLLNREFDGIEPIETLDYAKHDGRQYYRFLVEDNDFIQWTYRRSLLLMYMRIYAFIVYLLRYSHSFGKTTSIDDNIPGIHIPFDASLYDAYVKRNWLYFVYEQDQILDDLSRNSATDPDPAVCQEHIRYVRDLYRSDSKRAHFFSRIIYSDISSFKQYQEFVASLRKERGLQSVYQTARLGA